MAECKTSDQASYLDVPLSISLSTSQFEAYLDEVERLKQVNHTD